jgi:hypothetical protein
LEDLGADGRITLRWISNKTRYEDVDWFHVAQDREHGNEPSGFINVGTFSVNTTGLILLNLQRK